MKLRRIFKCIGLMVIIGSLGLSSPVIAAERTTNTIYQHDPRRNEIAMNDIVVDTAAIYGFKPSKDSVRLSEYADADWSNPTLVEEWKQQRIKYLQDFDSMYDIWNAMLEDGAATEEIAKAVSAKRNEIRLASYSNDPEGLAKVKKSNLDTYGNENGPTPESLFAKYGSWDKVLIKSFSSNAGMDACLGLYDIQYDRNILTNTVVEKDIVTYNVKRNDSLSKIADKYYGIPAAWKAVFLANKEQIKNADLIYEGQTLIIPLD